MNKPLDPLPHRRGYLDYQHQLIQARREALWRQCERWRHEQRVAERQLRELEMATVRAASVPRSPVAFVALVLGALLALGVGVGAVVAWVGGQP